MACFDPGFEKPGYETVPHCRTGGFVVATGEIDGGLQNWFLKPGQAYVEASAEAQVPTSRWAALS